jgi:predicted nucleic acid-binding protein
MSDGVVDTSVIVDYLRQKSIAQSWFLQNQRKRLVITPIVWMETIEGARSGIERDQILRFLRQFPIEHPTRDDNNWAMRQFAHFRLSHGVEFTDVLIASVAARLNAPPYTLNLKHYAALPNVNAVRPY